VGGLRGGHRLHRQADRRLPTPGTTPRVRGRWPRTASHRPSQPATNPRRRRGPEVEASESRVGMTGSTAGASTWHPLVRSPTGPGAPGHCLPNPIPLTQITAIAVRSNFSLTMFSLLKSNRKEPPALWWWSASLSPGGDFGRQKSPSPGRDCGHLHLERGKARVGTAIILGPEESCAGPPRNPGPPWSRGQGAGGGVRGRGPGGHPAP
jgi:hypothetical protein